VDTTATMDEGLFLRHRQEEEAALQQEPYRPYREIVAVSVQRALAAQGISIPDGEAQKVAATIGDWPPFPETKGALEALKEGRALVIVSNVDRSDIEKTMAKIGVQFDGVITAEDVRSYKPGRPHFQRVMESTGLPRERVLHVAQSLFHDIRPASDFGLDSAWINRLGETLPRDLSPRFHCPSLAALAAALAG
jgi:2-haloalkanoic acid dehalogenase type II